MALQTSGAISLNDIHVEAGGTSGSQAGLNDSDIRSLISKGAGAQMSFSEWYGAASDFTWDTADITMASDAFTATEYDDGGGPATASGTVRLTWDASSASYSILDNNSSVQSGTLNYSNGSAVTSVEARWIVANADIDIQNGDVNSSVKGLINGGTSFTRTVSDSDYDVTGAFVTMTPIVLGGSAGNTQDYTIVATSGEALENESSSISRLTLESGGSLKLELKVNYSGGSDTFTFTKPFVSTSNPIIEVEAEVI